jgi:hypothetical protein
MYVIVLIKAIGIENMNRTKSFFLCSKKKRNSFIDSRNVKILFRKISNILSIDFTFYFLQKNKNLVNIITPPIVKLEKEKKKKKKNGKKEKRENV